jgi:hypothetical protein
MSPFSLPRITTCGNRPVDTQQRSSSVSMFETGKRGSSGVPSSVELPNSVLQFPMRSRRVAQRVRRRP